MFACHLGVQSMRAVDADGVTGLERVRATLGEGTSGFQPRDSWTDRGMTDVKVRFIIAGLSENWPEI